VGTKPGLVAGSLFDTRENGVLSQDCIWKEELERTGIAAVKIARSYQRWTIFFSSVNNKDG
jgi:hypothetical protein